MENEPAGFRRRVIAFAIDLAICASVLAACAVALFAATGGRSQFIPGFASYSCRGIDGVPAATALPAGFTPNRSEICTHAVLGRPVARILRLTERTVEGNVTVDRSMLQPLDAQGTVLNGHVGRAPIEVIVVLFRLVLDGVRRSPGRRICGIAVVEAATGRRAPFSLLWRRYLLFSVPQGLGYLPFIPGLSPAEASGVSGSAIVFALVLALIVLALLFWILVSINARRPTFYGRPVGTSVERR